MISLIDALDGIVGIEPEPEVQPVAFQAKPEPEVQPGQVTGHILESAGSAMKLEQEHQPESKLAAIDAITIPEQEIQPKPEEPQSVPESAATPAEAITVSNTAPVPELVAEPSENNSVPDSGSQSVAALDEDATTENQLTGEISTLWGDHIRLSADRRATAAELRKIRAELSERLYRAKAILSRPDAGRGGKWKSWLREMGIPRSTADRLVSRYAETLGNENENVPSGALSQPAEADVERLAKNTWQRVGKHLTTGESVIEFIRRFAELAGARHEQRDENLVILKPVPEVTNEVPDSTPACDPVQQVCDETPITTEEPKDRALVVPTDVGPAVPLAETSTGVAA